jgi:D-arabinose 1-dehydrogenase-like Zn-dependent alcohol dehydrogenase
VPTTPARMRAAVMHAFAEPLTVEQVRDPDVPGDGVVIEARATGLCPVSSGPELTLAKRD